ncbi:MAG: ABC transporter ATP-binding protein [Tepidisphaeraceae bacterium]|jgi:ABC-type multidrug transport system fused ATPase/permease subunit
MSEQTNTNRPKVKGSKHRYFWRACRYLWPYRAKVAISIAAAFFVGLALTGGLTTMLPIMQVLINGDTVPGWMYRQTAQARLKVKLVADPGIVQISQVTAGPGKLAGLRVGDEIVDVSLPSGAPPSPFPAEMLDTSRVDVKAASYRAGEVARRIAWADRSMQLNIRGRGGVAVMMDPLKWYYALGLRVIQHVPLRPVTALAEIFAGLACLTLVGSVMRFFQEHLSDKAAILAANDIRRRVYDRVLRIPLSNLSQQGASDATSRLITDVDILQDGFKTVLGQSIQEPIKAIMMFCLAMYLSPQLTLFIILLVPLMGIMMKKFGKKMRRASRAALRSSSTLLGQIDGTLVGIRVVKGYNAEKFERRRYTRILDKLVAELLRMSRIDAISSPVMETIIMVVAGMVIILATYMVTEKQTLTQPSFFTVMFALAVIAESLRKASKVNNALQKSNAAAARVFETLDMLPEREVDTLIGKAEAGGTIAPRKLTPLRSRIEFQNVSFTYPNAKSPAVCGVSLIVPKGQSVAVVGRNGSGKTTLLALLERFFDPDGGRILIDGTDIRTATRTSLRELISLVTQDSHVFPGTFAENIAYGEPLADPEAPDSPERRELFERIEQAARQAFAHDFIVEKPGGYGMQLGGLGSQISGGQKQRLCIARAIFRQAPILILDEATSQVDAESEHLIHQAIESLMHERTTFVIAHRFSTILSADTIVVMERGQIVAQGKHDELLSSSEVYQQLYERQLIGAKWEE